MKSRFIFTLSILLFILSLGMAFKTTNQLEEGFYTGLSIFLVLAILRGITNKVRE